MFTPSRHPQTIAEFASPWSRALRWLTVLSLLVLIVVVAAALIVGPLGNAAWVAVLLVPAVIAVIASGFFTIRRYDLTPDALLVRRLGWTTSIDLRGLERAAADPQAMRDARRTFGKGQFSRFFNTYANRRLGDFQAFGKQEPHAVVLQFPQRTVVVTPAEPDRMVETLDRLVIR